MFAACLFVGTCQCNPWRGRTGQPFDSSIIDQWSWSAMVMWWVWWPQVGLGLVWGGFWADVGWVLR